jgi:hypothetical protein
MQKKILVGKVFSFMRKKNFLKAKNRQFRLEIFFQKKSTKDFKLVFPTNLTILYPNPQKKFQLLIIFEKI